MMTTTDRYVTINNGAMHQVGALADKLSGIVRRVAQPSLVQLILRVALATPFWRSGLLKWSGFLHLKDTTVYLFTSEFMLHLPGGPYPYPAPALFAFLSGCAEICLPVLLVFGFATRFAATGLLFMTCIVELTVPDGWPIHITWAAMALAIMSWGPGLLSFDYLVRRALGIPENACQNTLLKSSGPIV
jgi:putative oxidoreductase